MARHSIRLRLPRLPFWFETPIPRFKALPRRSAGGYRTGAETVIVDDDGHRQTRAGRLSDGVTIPRSAMRLLDKFDPTGMPLLKYRNRAEAKP